MSMIEEQGQAVADTVNRACFWSERALDEIIFTRAGRALAAEVFGSVTAATVRRAHRMMDDDMRGSIIAWAREEAITMLAADAAVPVEHVAEVIDGLEPRPGLAFVLCRHAELPGVH